MRVGCFDMKKWTRVQLSVCLLGFGGRLLLVVGFSPIVCWLFVGFVGCLCVGGRLLLVAGVVCLENFEHKKKKKTGPRSHQLSVCLLVLVCLLF